MASGFQIWNLHWIIGVDFSHDPKILHQLAFGQWTIGVDFFPELEFSSHFIWSSESDFSHGPIVRLKLAIKLDSGWLSFK